MDHYKPVKESESGAAPSPLSQSLEYQDCTYICFYNDSNNLDESGFKINSPILSLKKYQTKNLIVLCVYCEGFFNKAVKLFKSTYYFKLSYDYRDNFVFEYPLEFTVEKNKIKFIFDAGNENSIKGNHFKNPSCLEQYNAFYFVSKNHEKLFEDAKNHLKWNLDIELFLYLMNDRKDKKEELMNIFMNFPNFKIKFNINKPLPKIDFEQTSRGENHKKLILIYSIITDSTELLKDFKENDILDFIEYNGFQKDNPLIIQKNIFDFFISKTEHEFLIKKVCMNVYSIPLLFNYLLTLNSELFKKIKKLTINDIPNRYVPEDDVLSLIEKYEKIKEAIDKNEFDKIIKRYLNSWYVKKSIKQLEELIDKISSNQGEYTNIINEIKNEIVKKGKLLIKKNSLKSFEMFQFINKYKNVGNFFSEELLLNYIGENIILEEMKSDENILKEFNKCNFLEMINFQLINKFISGILSKINNIKNFDLFFKYIFIIKQKENGEKNNICVDLILTHFNHLLTRIQEFKMNDEFKYTLQKIIILSVMYIPDENENNFKIIISNLRNNGSFHGDNLFNIFIDIIINSNLEIYISKEEKEKVCEFIINKFYFYLNIEKKIDYLLKIKSIELKEKLIFNNHQYFPIIKFSDLLDKEGSIFFNNMKYFIKKGLLTNEDFLKGNYYKIIFSECNSIRERLEKKEVNFSELNKIKELIIKNKISDRIF